MKIPLAASLLAALFSSVAHADFTGAYAIELWTIAQQGGTVRTSSVAAVLTGNDTGLANANQDLSFTAFENATITFDWIFSTSDQGIGGTAPAERDPFGYLNGGSFFRVTDNAGANSQSGTTSFNVLAGEVFGFRETTVDGLGGAARVRVSNFAATPSAAVVPLPSAVWLMLTAISGLILVQRRSASERMK